MKDETILFNFQGDDEVMFLEFRKTLKILFQNIGQLVTYVMINDVEAQTLTLNIHDLSF